MSAGGILGAVAGFFIGGPKGALYGYQIGSIAGSIIDPPKGPNIQGPRLNDLSVQTSTYGAVIPRGYGTFPVVGNVFWLENNALKEVATTTTTESGGKGGGGGSSTTTSFAYYATFAVGLLEGPIVGVRRIWVGAKLIYDAGATDITQLAASAEASGLFTVHYGTDTQLADDRMQATLGVADTPAYRGLAYIVLKDYPLADHGNNLIGAQVKVEVVKGGSGSPISFPTGSGYPSFYTAGGNPERGIDPGGYIWRLSASTTTMYRVHVPSGRITAVRSATSSTGMHLNLSGFDTTGRMLCIRNSAAGVSIIEPSGAETVIAGAPNWQYNSWGVNGYWVAPANDLSMSRMDNAGNFSTVSAPACNGWGELLSGNVQGGWVYYLARYTTGSITRLCRIDPVNAVFQSLFDVGSAYRIGAYPGTTHVVAGADGYFYLYNVASDTVAKFDAAGTLIATAPAGCGIPYLYHPTGKVISYQATGNKYYVLDAETLASNGFSTQAGNPCFDGFGSGAMMIGSTSAIVVDTVAQSLPTLSSIVSAECLASNLLTSGDIDVTGLTQTVRGYRIGAVGSIRSAIEPLQGTWPFDAVQHGYIIKFVPRGGASIATVPAGDLDARAAGEAPGTAVTLVREMDSILPARVSLRFLDADREYDAGEQYYERINTDAINIRSLDMAIVLTAAEAAAIVQRLLYLYWLERYDVSIKLPATYNQVEPADVITVNADEGTYVLRLAAITYTQDGRLECQAKYHSAATYTPSALGESGQSTGSTVAYIGDSSLELLDIPLLLDATDTAGFVAAMSGYGAGWPGGVLVQTLDSGQTWTNLRGFAAPGCVMGIAFAAIGAGRIDLMDKASLLQVSLRSGSLASVSESALFNGANHFAYGAHGRWEIIGAQNCVLQGDGTYILSDLLRGRFGTDWSCGTHGANDTIVALDSSRLAFIAISLNAIGSARTYRGVTSGKAIGSASDVSFTYTGVNLECLSPVYLNGNRHPGTNDWSLDWIRRTRIGGEWRDYVDATLGEASESYEVDIFSSNTYATLKRTLTGLTTPAATYTSAQQVTDFGSNQATLYVKVYQLSGDVGRGYPLTTSITR